jgi:hypothetical protein
LGWRKNWNAHFIASPKTSTWVAGLGVATSMLDRRSAMETSIFVKEPGPQANLKMNNMGMGKVGKNIPGWSYIYLSNIGS